MYYKPHTIQYRRHGVTERDEWGRPLPVTERWEDGGQGRCDDNTIQELYDDNGRLYKSTYKVVIEGYTDIKPGDDIKVYWRDGRLRGEGSVNNVSHCNALNYSVVWV